MKKILFIVSIVSLLVIKCYSGEIVIIHSYHSELNWVNQCEKGIMSVIGDKHNVSSFYMDTKRIKKNRFRAKADSIWKNTIAISPDLIMIGDDIALKLLGERLSEIEIPVVFFGINNNPRNYFENYKIPSNITGVLESLPIFPWIRYLKKILPDAENALVLMDSSPTTEAIINTSFRDENEISFEKVTVEYQIAEDWNNWKGIIDSSEKYDFILLPTFHNVKDGDLHIEHEKLLKWTSANSKKPVFTHQDYAVGDGYTVGAYVVFGETHGARAGLIALSILEDKKRPSELSPVLDNEGKFFFNEKQLRRFNISLPEGILQRSIFK